MYQAAKLLHQATAVITIVLFVLRGVWAINKSPALQKRWVRILPHVNDSILLGCAVTLCVLTGQYPFVNDWLTAKVFLLAIYIGLGMVVMRSSIGDRARVMTWLAAIVIFAVIVKIALTKEI